MRIQISILIGSGTRGAICIRRRIDALSERTGIVVDTAYLLLRSCGDRHGVVTAVDRGNISQVDDYLIRATEFISAADKIDLRRCISRRVDFTVVAVNDGAGGISRGDVDYIKNIT